MSAHMASVWNELLIKFENGLGGHRLTWLEKDFKFHPYDRVFWNRVRQNAWEPETLAFLQRHLRAGTTFVDVGAWIGPTSIYAASCGARVLAFEPDPFAYERLLFNINKNSISGIQTVHGALGVRTGTLPLTSSRGLGKSFSRLRAEPTFTENIPQVTVPVLDWATVDRMFKLPQADLVKIDIEGGEFDIFPPLAPLLKESARRILLSLHGPALRKQELQAKFGDLQKATELFARRTDLQGRPWQWNRESIVKVETKYTEIVLEN